MENISYEKRDILLSAKHELWKKKKDILRQVPLVLLQMVWEPTHIMRYSVTMPL